MNPSDDQPQLPQVQPQSDDTADDASAMPLPPQPQPQPMPTGDPSHPQSADDVDLIEKAWVDKAKQIVDNTMGDPHAQSERLGKMKADYIRKRYGKDIKT